jgi:hypothetical protein
MVAKELALFFLSSKVQLICSPSVAAYYVTVDRELAAKHLVFVSLIMKRLINPFSARYPIRPQSD